MGNDDNAGDIAGPSRLTMAPSILAASSTSTDYESYWQSANLAAEPIQSSIRRRLPRFPSPPLRIQRVSQLDAEILDSELTSMLMEPVKMALRNIKSTLPTTLEHEMLLVLRLILYKFSIYERGTTYGAMLQNLRYRNEWAHRGGLQSTSRDAPLSRLQLTLFPALTILLPYLHNKLERQMSHLSYSDMPASDPRRILWNSMDQVQRVYAALTLANFLAFLGDGR
jgi:peroxin-2